MKTIALSKGPESLREIGTFLQENNHEGYSLSIFDIQKRSAVEIHCPVADMVKALVYAASVEYDCPAWIGIDEDARAYVVGMNFNRGVLHTPSCAELVDGKLHIIAEF